MPETSYSCGDGGADVGASGLSGSREDSEQPTDSAKATIRNRAAVQRIEFSSSVTNLSSPFAE
jgi:hypothetical protein